jgi:hypothetical protein
VVPPTGSHKPLQQSARDEHGAPAPAQAPGTTQRLPTQFAEQQSDAAPHGSPNPRHAGAGELASQKLGAPSPVKSVWASTPASLAWSGFASALLDASSMSSAPHAPRAAAASVATSAR